MIKKKGQPCTRMQISKINSLIKQFNVAIDVSIAMQAFD